MRTTLSALCCTVLLAPAAFAAPCSTPDYAQFDFLVGDWVVHSRNGTLQGENVISREENGCLLVERWRGAQGATGQSYNYYHIGKGHWHQLWVSRGAVIDYVGGLTADGAMHLEGEIVYQANGVTARFMGRWTPRTDGTVLQELKQYNDEKQAWDEWFTGIYTRKP